MDLNPEDEAEGVASWQTDLERFERFYWPMFRLRGYDRNMAYLCWTLNTIRNTLDSNHSSRDTDEGDEWKR